VVECALSLTGEYFMAMTVLNLRPEPEPEDQTGTVLDVSPGQETGSSFAGAVTERVLEICNPFELLEVGLDDPWAAVALLALLGVVILAAISLNGLWSAAQEALSGGAPPPGIGLR
jgi:hypothetical protein